MSAGTFWTGVAVAAVVHVVVLWLSPALGSLPRLLTRMEFLALSPPFEVTPRRVPQPGARPAIPGVDGYPVAALLARPPAPVVAPVPRPLVGDMLLALMDEPAPTPFEVAPVLRNRDTVVAALTRLVDEFEGITDRAQAEVWFLIDEFGTLHRTVIKASTGLRALDEAVLEIAGIMEFTPAWSGGRAVPVWVALPIIFRVGPQEPDTSLSVTLPPPGAAPSADPGARAGAPIRRFPSRSPDHDRTHDGAGHPGPVVRRRLPVIPRDRRGNRGISRMAPAGRRVARNVSCKPAGPTPRPKVQGEPCVEPETVSTIIPAYDAAEHLGRAIESALEQARPPDEVLVVDDGSTDETAAVAGSYAPFVRVLRHGRNRGLAAARNTGARHARGDWVALLDADDRWEPEKLERQLAALAEAPDVVVAFCLTRIVTLDGRWFVDSADVPRPQDDPAGFTCALLRRNAVSGSGCSPLIRRDALVRAGGWNESLRTCEDWDLWLRLVRVARFMRLDETLCEGYVRPSGLSLRLDWIVDDARTVLRRHLPEFVPDPRAVEAIERDALARIARHVESLLARPVA